MRLITYNCFGHILFPRNHGFRSGLFLPVAHQQLLLLLMGQKIKLQLFLQLLEQQQVLFRFVSRLLQLALQLGDLRLPFIPGVNYVGARLPNCRRALSGITPVYSAVWGESVIISLTESLIGDTLRLIPAYIQCRLP